MAEDKPSFTLPTIFDNDLGWGPASNVLPDQFRDIPYAPYSKADKLGRIADWSSPEQNKDGQRDTTVSGRGTRQGGYNRYNRDQYQAYGSGVSSAFAYTHNEDEASFSVVDNRSAAAKKASGFRTGTSGRGNRGGQRGGAQSSGYGRGGSQSGGGYGRQLQNMRDSGFRGRGGRGGSQGRRRFGWKDYDKPQRMRDASVNVGADWRVLDEIDFVRLSKLAFNVGDPEDVATYGFINYYDKSYDRVTTRNEKPLQHNDRAKYETTTSDDPVIQQFIKDDEATVFATDSILALLMCSTRTAYPWDIVINRIDDKVIFDKRDGGVFDYVTVNENTADPPMETGDKDNINSPSALSVEATFINQNFAFQVINEEEKYEFENPNPFVVEDNEPLASCGYRYRRFDLTSKQQTSGDDDDEPDEVSLIVRTELDAAVANPAGDPLFITIRALNEFDPKAQGAGGALDWRQKLDSQRGAVVATEMKNNSAKLARWAVQAILAGADQMKLGYIARISPKDNNRHAILGTQPLKPREFATQMNVNLANGWGIVKAVVDMCLRLAEGKYVLVKDPNKPILRFYAVPIHTFEEEPAAMEEEPQFEEEEEADAEK